MTPSSLLSRAGPLLALIVLVALLGWLVPDFLSLRNAQGLLLSVTLVGTIAATMMLRSAAKGE